jgi:hypothetical protein
MTSPQKPRRSLGLEGIKLLLGSGAMAATIGLWSVFANRDYLTELASQPIPSEVAPVASEIMLELPPVPTLVPFVSGSTTPIPTSQPSALTTEGLRSVSAPVQPSINPSAPRVVQASGGGGGGGGGGSGTVTTTRSS